MCSVTFPRADCILIPFSVRSPDTIKKVLGEPTLTKITAEAEQETERQNGSASHKDSEVVLSQSTGTGRAQFILELTNELEKKTKLVRKLEDDVVKKDLEIGQLQHLADETGRVMKKVNGLQESKAPKGSTKPSKSFVGGTLSLCCASFMLTVY